MECFKIDSFTQKAKSWFLSLLIHWRRAECTLVDQEFTPFVATWIERLIAVKICSLNYAFIPAFADVSQWQALLVSFFWALWGNPVWSIYVSNTQVVINQKASMLLTSLSNCGIAVCFPITQGNGFDLCLNDGVYFFPSGTVDDWTSLQVSSPFCLLMWFLYWRH